LIGSHQNRFTYFLTGKIASHFTCCVQIIAGVKSHLFSRSTPSFMLSLIVACGVFAISMASPNLYAEGNATVPAAVGGGLTTNINPNLFTGTAGATIPIEIPPGRNGLQPNLMLTYQSSAGNSWLGVGWSLEVGRIQRKSRHGVDYNGDDYQLNMNGALVDLVYVGPDGNDRRYQAKIEGSFYRIKKITNGDYWEVTDKMGTRHLFGQTNSSRRMYFTGNRIFAWGLDYVEDIHTNYMTYTYSNASTQLYLDRIYYTGHAATNTKATNQIAFYTDAVRPDNPYLYTVPYIPTRFNIRLKAITISANVNPGITQGNPVRTYALTYTQSPDTNRTLLASVQQFGKDATVLSNGNVTGGTALPAATFGYQVGGTGFSQTVTSNVLDWGYDDGRAWVDHNGDGLTDYCRVIGAFNQVRCTLSTGSGFGAEVTSGTLDGGYAEGSAWVDFNADGKADYCRLISSGSVRCTLSTGSGFGAEYTSGTLDGGHAESRQWADFNGDGRADYCRVNGGNSVVMCIISTGSGFGAEYSASILGGGNPATGQWTDYNGDGKADYCRIDFNNWGRCTVSTGSGFGLDYNAASLVGASGYQWADFNGDGLADLCAVINGTVRCTLSNGLGTSSEEYTSASLDVGAVEGRQWVDFNGDGKADFCRLDAGNAVRCILSTGLGFGVEHTSGTLDGGYGNGRQWVDFNGDGKQDYCRRIGGSGNTLVSCTMATAPVSDLLVSTSNGIGGSTTLEYTPSTQYNNNGNLPFVVQTLNKVTTWDGNGNSAVTTEYLFGSGYYHIPEKDFRGFNYANVRHPAGPNGEKIETNTWFYQGADPDGYLKGKPYDIETWTRETSVQAFVLHSRVVTSYVTDTSVPYFNPPQQVDTYLYDGAATPKITHTTYGYDAYGNVNLEYQYGDYINGSNPAELYDDRTVQRLFTSNEGPWIVGLPLAESIYKGIGPVAANKATDTWFYYDGSNTCNTASSNQVPTKGNLTRILRWHKQGAYPETRMAYDQYGNLTCVRDANGNQTTTFYDNNFTFPTATVSPLITAIGEQLTTTTTYYTGTSADAGLYGQIKTVRDVNNSTNTTTTYDALGRVKTIAYPDGSSSTTNYVSFGGGILNQHIRTDTTAGLQSWTYFDGFGRTILAKATGSSATEVIRTGTQYDTRGQVWKTTLPYIEGQPAGPETVYTYDSSGRVVRTDNPDGTRSLACYEPFVIVTIDPKNHRRRQATDAYGRLQKVEEYTGTHGSCSAGQGSPYATTLYEYDVLGNLTKLTDDQGNQTLLTYDSLSRKIAMNDPDMGIWSYTYDANGNLLTQVDAKNQTITFTYDELNRVKTKTNEDIGPQTYTLTVNKTGGAGSGLVTSSPDGGIDCGSDCTEDYIGETVTLTATPGTNSTFAGWSGGGCSGTGTCQVTMDQDRTVTATFNITSGSFSRITNISTRGYVGTGANVQIGGFIIEGTEPKTVVIRARGPSMAGPPFNIQGTLPNPYVTLYSGSTPIAKNNNWQTTDSLCAGPLQWCGNTQDIVDAGYSPCNPNPGQSTAPPGCNNESALMVRLPPGGYTAIMQGVGSNKTGVGIVEVHEIQ